jgi:hypothetical protein
MATDKRIGRKAPSWTDPNKVTGAVSTPGPYIGIVKNNVDPNRSGRVQVFIPDFGGKEDEVSHWITIQYASPYMGSTRWPSYKTERPGINDYSHVNHTYGMWMTPPDIGNFVMVIFVNGDINRGYWFACVMPELTHHALPAIAGGNAIQLPNDAALSEAMDVPPYPVVEFNDAKESFKSRWGDFLNIPKPVHEDLLYKLLAQGLENDKVRGVISSSSQRESPSAVFGISTPGRPGPDKDDVTSAIENRKGGHSIVMDDGDIAGKDQMIRLRTAGGHQILMNDKEEVIYIANSTGTAWMEFTKEGKMHFYAENDVNIRTKKDFNLHSDHDINMYAANNIKMFAGKDVKHQADTMSLKATNSLIMRGRDVSLSAGSTLSLEAATTGSWRAGTDLIYSSDGKIYLNTMGAPAAARPKDIDIVSHAETVPTKSPPIYKWKQEKTVQSTIPVAAPIPTHEPSVKLGHKTGVKDGTLTASDSSTPVTSGSGAPVTSGSGAPVTSGTSPVPPSAAGAGVKNPANKATLALQPPNVNGIGSLTAAQTTALKAQMGKSESGMNYAADNTKIDAITGKASLGYIGKYQFGATALADQGYVNPGTSLQGMNDPANWRKADGTPLKDGIGSKADFLAAHDVQEKVMDVNLQNNYNALKRSGTITADSSPDDVAGKLAVSHLLGAGGTNKWAKGQGGADANGTTGDQYYNKGRYAVNVLAGPTTG